MTLIKVSCVVLLCSCCLTADLATAVSPEMVKQGRVLFEREWTATNPMLGGDGLGPLFNGKSCVACHNQGGIGGAGEAKFNAKSIGIERMQISGLNQSTDLIAAAARGFHPGFVDATGGVANTFAISHHGGTSEFDRTRRILMENSLAKFSQEGGPISAAEVRYANATPLLYNGRLGDRQVTIRARLYQRNTTPLFGAGLIDQVTGKQLEKIVRIQERNPEISGRIGTKPNGHFGRFGWRANVATLLDFCDQACAAEVGLETNRKTQPADPTNANYRNPSIDITDDQILTMAAFVAALPAPQRIMPDNTDARHEVKLGEKLFASVGCAACHVPNVGPAQGLYSDLLLHDMGNEAVDLNSADPFIQKVSPVSNYDRNVVTRTNTSITQDAPFQARNFRVYYGSTVMITGGQSFIGGIFDAPIRSRDQVQYLDRGSVSEPFSQSAIAVKADLYGLQSHARTPSGSWATQRVGVAARETEGRIIRTDYLKVEIKGTNVAQEWRTPPLWGVRDSAPYMHDGRAETLLEAITMHDGEGAATRDRFLNLSLPDRHAIIAFLNTMVAPQNLPQPAS
ncbi:MAG: di-heme oxidoredictase family protein [Pirellulaceae bacterium]